MDKNNLNLLLAWYASTHTKRGPLTSKDKAMLKWLAGILGVAFLGELLILTIWVV